MTIRRVWDGGTGAGDGSTWTDAYTTLETALAAWVEYDVIWMASDHYESFSGADKLFNWTGELASPTHIYSIARGDDSYTPATSAQIEVTSYNELSFADPVAAHGLYLKSGKTVIFVSIIAVLNCDSTYEFNAQGDGQAYGLNFSGSAPIISFRNCTFKSQVSNGPWYGVLLRGSRHAVFENCTVAGKITQGVIYSYWGAMSRWVGCDFSGVTNTSGMAVAIDSSEPLFENCKLPSGWTIQGVFNSHYPGRRPEVIGSGVDGASTANLYGYTAVSNMSYIDHTTSIYRDDGYQAADGNVRLAHIIAPDFQSVNSDNAQVSESMEMVTYVDSVGSKTIRIEALHDYTTAPTKNELWIEVVYLGTTNSCKSSVAGGRVYFSSANWTTSTAAWTGAGSYSKIKLEETITINRPGPISVVLFLGKYESGKTLVYCPKVEID